jgi:hypothetical protein
MFEYLDEFDTRAKSREGEWVDLFVPGSITPAVHPGTKVPLRMRVIGPDNPVTQDLRDEIERRNSRHVGLSAEGFTKNEVYWAIQYEVWPGAILAWEGFEEPCTPENVAKVFARVRAWFLQTWTFSAGRAAFLPKAGNGGSASSGDGPRPA